MKPAAYLWNFPLILIEFLQEVKEGSISGSFSLNELHPGLLALQEILRYTFQTG